MEKIFSFSDFSALYEAEGENTEAKIYEQNLKIVVSDLLALYYELTDYGAYTDAEIDSDLQSIVAGNSLGDKTEAFKNIISKVKQKALTTDKIEGAKDLINMIDSAYNKYLEALTYIVDKYKDSPDESASMIEFVNNEIEEYKNFLDETNESNSNFSEDSQIFEGKKSLLSDAEGSINSLRGKIDSYKMDEDPRKKKFATDVDLEIVKISNNIKGLKDKKNRDIEKSEIEKIFNDLAELETKFDTGINKIIDESTTDAELERLRNKARDVKDQISSLRNTYLKNKALAEDKGKSEKIKVKLETDYIDYVPEETKNVNPEVKKFQELVTDTFKNIKSVADLSFYKKMGTDGKFGPNTRDMVKFLKAAFGLKDRSGDITKELADEIQIQKDTIHESISSRVFSFSSFVNISEGAFNLTSGLEFAKNLPTFKSTGSSSASSVKGSSSGSTKSYKEGATGTVITAIQNILGANATGNFDSDTVSKVKEFQKLNNLKEDGVVGKGTFEAIYGTRDSAKTHKLVDGNKSRRGPWSYEVIGKAIKQVYVKPTGAAGSSEQDKPKEVVIDQKKIDEIAQNIYDGSIGTTDEEKITDAIMSIKNKEEFKAVEKSLRDIFAENGEESQEYPIKFVINDEFDNHEFDEVKKIVKHLKSMGIDASFGSKTSFTGGRDFDNGTFKYTY